MTSDTNEPTDQPGEVDALRERVAALVGDWDGVEAVTMFGRPCFTAREALFCVVSEQGLSLTRLSEADRAGLAEQSEVTAFDADGRPIERWATVAAADLPDDETLVQSLRASYEAALEEERY